MRFRTTALIICCLSALMCAGCVVLSLVTGTEREIPFTHATHVVKQEMTCEICHADAETGEKAGMPGRDVCITCHEVKPEKAPKDYERKITEAKELVFQIWNKSPDVVFSHQAHVAKGVTCVQCHGAVDQSTEIDETAIAGMDGCVQCHSEKRIANECSTCHKELRLDAKPSTHDVAFLRVHGRDIRGSANGVADGRCLLCHAPSSAQSCERCHTEMPPADHTDFWRRKGHGLAAEVDRVSCATCHREDSCIRCHTQVRPSSHVGAFGGTVSAHCFSCHEPLQSNACAACHASTPSHDFAPPKPPPPHPGANADCRSCHLPNLLTHSDNGQNCNICHR